MGTEKKDKGKKCNARRRKRLKRQQTRKQSYVNKQLCRQVGSKANKQRATEENQRV